MSIALFGVVAVVLFSALRPPVPAGEAGPAAEALARQLVAAVDGDAWERTGAVRWTFAGRHHHLWDRQRHWARVRWDDVEAQVDLNTRRGQAWRDGQLLAPDEAAPLIEEAWKHWVNDAFWLNPVVKIFDPGTERRLARQKDGTTGLLVSYSSGGNTPGDSYLWLPGPDGLPAAWRMWVSIIPIRGLRASWENWITLATGARVATRHRILVFDLELEGVAGAETLSELDPGPDPFASMAQALEPDR